MNKYAPPAKNKVAMEVLGIHAGLIIIILVVISLVLLAALLALFSRYQQVTREAIKGFSDILAALNAIRSDIQINDNSLMGKMSDIYQGLNEKIENVKQEVTSHLQYIRDRTK